MTSAEEWSNTFDLSLNNITSNQAPGFSEYEKSVFLTKAQNELVKNWYDASSKGNVTGRGFDENAIRQMDFSSLTVSVAEKPLDEASGSDPRALVYSMPSSDSVIAIINEQIGLAETSIDTISQATELRQVIPLSYQEYMRLMSKPFKEPLKWQAWRLLSNGRAEVILTSSDRNAYKGRLYIMRYVKKPYPIILEDLSSYGDITIEGKSAPQNPVCELSESTHDAILQRAVELAKTAWETDVNQQQMHIASGQRSE